MSWGPLAPLVLVLTLSLVLATSGLAKLRDHRATRDAFTALRVPSFVPAGPAAAALPWVEVALAVLLVVAPAGWLVPVAAVTTALLAAYTALVARALASGVPVACACFGSLGRHEVDRTTVARNVLLTLAAGAVLGWAATGGAAAGAAADLDASGWWALLAAAVAAAIAALVAGRPGGDPEADAPGDADLDYERRPVPYAVVARPGDRPTSLWELTSAQARLVVVLQPRCEPCVRTAARLDEWAARLDPAVGVLAVYPDEVSAAAQTEHDPALTVVEPELNVQRTFSVGTPAAVLLGADGHLAGGPVAGEGSVARFVDEVLDALAGPRDS